MISALPALARSLAFRAVVLALVVLGLLAIVAAASRPGTQSGEPSLTVTVPQELFVFLAALALIVTVVIVRILNGSGRDTASRRGSWLAGLIILMAILLLFALFPSAELSQLLPSPAPAGSQAAPAANPSLAPQPSAAAVPLPDAPWQLTIGAAALALAALAAILWLTRGSGVAPAEGRMTPEEDLLAHLDLDAALAGADHRLAVIAAYATVLRIFAANGLGRAPGETPDEYAGRVARERPACEPAFRALTTHYQWARFSHHQVHGAMRAEAVGALSTLREIAAE